MKKLVAALIATVGLLFSVGLYAQEEFMIDRVQSYAGAVYGLAFMAEDHVTRVGGVTFGTLAPLRVVPAREEVVYERLYASRIKQLRTVIDRIRKCEHHGPVFMLSNVDVTVNRLEAEFADHTYRTRSGKADKEEEARHQTAILKLLDALHVDHDTLEKSGVIYSCFHGPTASESSCEPPQEDRQ
ncbi:MAG: hypothetical protein HY791_14315 [Deltaproteobacteria bacterium]|nr:hypothetical protein [Deltaproteobacteria bacterium]